MPAMAGGKGGAVAGGQDGDGKSSVEKREGTRKALGEPTNLSAKNGIEPAA